MKVSPKTVPVHAWKITEVEPIPKAPNQNRVKLEGYDETLVDGWYYPTRDMQTVLVAGRNGRPIEVGDYLVRDLQDWICAGDQLETYYEAAGE